MKIIDGHMHIGQWIREDGKPLWETMADYQRDNGIAYLDNMSCSNNANLWGGYEMDQSILGAISKLENSTLFSHGCLYIPPELDQTKNYDFKDQLDELMELGLDGIKICDFKPDAYIKLDVEKRLRDYEDFIGYCERNNVHMCWHVADPEHFWDENKVSEGHKKIGWFYGNGNYPSFEKLIAYAYQMLEAHPNLKVMLAHAFFKSYDPDEVTALLERYPNVCLDLAPGWEMFDGFATHYEKWYSIFRTYSDRFVYATDSFMTGSSEGMNRNAQDVLRFLQTDDVFDVQGNFVAHGIKLGQEELENILYKNHENRLGKVPREVNRKSLKKYIERYLPLMPDSHNKQMTEVYYRKNLL